MPGHKNLHASSAVSTHPVPQHTHANGHQLSTGNNGRTSSSGELIKANTGLFVWLIFLSFGGGILALYYAKIGYLPDMEWSSSLIYIAVASIIGGGVGGVLFLSLFLPGFIWAEYLVCDRQLVRLFCYREEGGKGRHEPSVILVFAYLGLPFGLVFSIAHFFLEQGWKTYLITSAALIVAGSFIVFSIFTWTWWIRKWNKVCARKKPHFTIPTRIRRFQYVFWFDLSVVLSLVSTYLIFDISDYPRGAYFYYLIAICVSTVLISNHVVATRFRQHPWRSAGASFVAAVILLIVGNQFSSLTEQIMSLYGYGKANVTILLNDEGTQIIGRLGLPDTSCGPVAQGKLCGVEVLSGVGSEYYLRLNGTTFTLPKSAIVSRSVSVKSPQ